jgi:hypothetical protein
VATGKKAAPRRKAAASTSASRSGTPAARAARAAKEKRALRNRLIFGGLLLVVAGVVIFASATSNGGGADVDAQLGAGAGSCTVDTRSDPISAQGVHVPKPTYEVNPPAGGSHLNAAAEPGFYKPDEVPADGELVHAMEHGFVVLWYRPDLPAAKMDALSTLSDSLGRELLLAPRASLTGEVAVTAWHHRMLCGELVPEKVRLFTRTYVDQGPEKGFL